MNEAKAQRFLSAPDLGTLWHGMLHTVFEQNDTAHCPHPNELVINFSPEGLNAHHEMCWASYRECTN